MAKRKRLTRIPLMMSMGIAFVLIVFMGTFFAIRQFGQIERESATIKNEFIEERRDLIASSTESLAEYAALRKTLSDGEMRDILSAKVDEAHASIISIYKANQADVEKARIKAMALDFLRKVRFNKGRGHYFAVSMEGRELLNPISPELEGDNLMETGSPEVSSARKSEIELIKRRKQGFVENDWPKPDEEGSLKRKTSYIKYVEPFDMYIGAGDFHDDYSESVKEDILIEARQVSDRVTVKIVDYGKESGQKLKIIDGDFDGDEDFLDGIEEKDLLAIIMDSQKYEGAFIDQSIRAMNTDLDIPSLVYVRHIPEWDIALVAYSNLYDMKNFLSAFSISLQGELRWQLSFLLFAFLITLAFAYSMAGYYRNMLGRQIGLFSDFRRDNKGKRKLDLKKFKYFELYRIARIMNRMMESNDRMSRDLEESEEKFRGFFELSPDLIFVINFKRGIIEDANPAFIEKLGFNMDELKSIPLSRLFKTGDDQKFIERYSGLKEAREIRNLHFPAVTKSGEEIKLEITARLAQGKEKDMRVLNIARDVTERLEKEMKIRNMAFNDFLTEIPNRNKFMIKLDALLGKVEGKDYSFAMAFIDLDRFKIINDTLGHNAGDQLLVKVAKRLKACIRSTDMLARLGGDEFVILFADTSSKSGVEAVVKKVLQVFKDPFYISKRSVFITASIGVSMYPRDGFTAEELMIKSDKAMYLSKDSGRNTYRFYTGSIEEDNYQGMKICELKEAD